MSDLATVLTASITPLIAGKIPGATTQDIYSATDDTLFVYVRNVLNVFSSINLTCIPAYTSLGTHDFGILITPSIWVTAAHYGAPTSGKWVDASNITYSRTVVSSYQVPGTDILLNSLSSALPAAITPAPIFGPDEINRITAKMAPNATNPPLSIYTRQDRRLYVGTWMGTYGTTQSNNGIEIVDDPVSGDPLAFSSDVVGGDSGSSVGVILDGNFVALTDWWTSNMTTESTGPSLAFNYAGIVAGIAALGLSEVPTVIPTASYDAIPDPPPAPTPGGPGVTSTYRIYADGTGDFTTYAAFLADASVLLDPNDIQCVCKGTSAQLGAFNYNQVGSAWASMRVVPLAGGEPTPGEPTGNEYGMTSFFYSPQSGDPCTRVEVGGTCLGRAQATLGAGGEALDTVVFGSSGNPLRVGIAAASATTSAIFVNAMPAGGDGSTRNVIIGNLIMQSAGATGANYSLVQISTTQNCVVNVKVYQASLDGTCVKGTGGGFRLVGGAGSPTFTMDAQKLTMPGTSVSVATSGTGTYNYAASCDYNVTTDNNTSLLGAHGITGKTTATEWVNIVTGDFNLKFTAGSTAIATTSPVLFDFNGDARPRTGGIVDAGAVNFQLVTSSGSGRNRLSSTFRNRNRGSIG